MIDEFRWGKVAVVTGAAAAGAAYVGLLAERGARAW